MSSEKAISSLCVTEGVDRPMTAMFIGLRAQGIDLTVAGSGLSLVREQLTDGGVPIIDLHIGNRVNLGAIRRLRVELKRGDYDILHSFTNNALTNGLVASWGLPVRIIAYRGMVGNVSFFSLASWLRYLNPRISRILCVANAIRDYYLEMRPAFLRMPAERPVTIYKGHDLDWYNEQPADLSKLGIPPGAFVVGCVANYRPRKGIELLVDAMGQLPPSVDAHLLLVGHDMDTRALRRCIEASPVRERIHVPGFRQDAPVLTAACDVFVLPSRKREGLARSLIEAMAYAIAPVATDCGGSPELVVDGECGIIIPVNDVEAIAQAIAKLYADPELRSRFGQAARERIGQHFNIKNTIRQTADVYRELVEGELESGSAALH